MKKQIQIIVIILILPIIGLCQNKFSFGANANTQISLITINDSQAASGIDEKGGIGVGYSIGIQAQYGLNEKIFLRSGINYQNRKNRHKIEGLRFGTDIMNGTESSIQNDITITSIGIPVDFGYSIKSKSEKINYVIGFGGVINVNSDSKTEAKVLHEQIDDENLTQAENEVDESIYTIGIFGGVEMQLSDKMILGIEPNFRFTPNNFNLYLYNSEASTFETGITLRIRMK
ncbi:MAG: outer membrane beta-barrel protein [Lewinellaceae bacterium]|nr:outer membrane beta-barrel protein [Lewinellaceae bacterium]